MKSLVPESPWTKLRQYTPARIGLPRSGASVATAAQLDFQLAHAQARDAVHDALDVAKLLGEIKRRGLQAVCVHSQAPDRHAYLARPDLGRKLADESRQQLNALKKGHDLIYVIADGLSAQAVMRHALPLLDEMQPQSPVIVAVQGRVAIGDEIGAMLGAKMVAVVIGERPGLSSPDSLGVYVTWQPHVGRKDSERNCISNIRPEGLSYKSAASKLRYLIGEGTRRKLTGVLLKEQSDLGLLQR